MDLKELETKQYFSIGDVSRISGVPEYSIRYWESEFRLIRPIRKESGHRRYKKEDVYTVLKVKDLIYKHKMTLEGVKKYMNKITGVGQHALKENTSSEDSPNYSAKDKNLLKDLADTLGDIIKD
ncbi:MAG: MerR family transcriptional regulator [Elusimicrobiaceae bacterium]|jgi:DNA-binding transcriptional MerR regulator|nr:MerR family transcriptional regulator [Elusimicrobiaceae bacterium]MBT3954739.1 MerR family transcriptional regulator [Elusimicrobiaceae bacterium]MBT4008331.1 MerR family transcriptional regulator [Elusimicrobiaceae bacterium]MBT4403059.1 MerR family transcriptional regulator [Elusimicrobiaceae bacterium]MBT4439375.1 MerR family transcriptional regulator [Elusimicrobiaceae bacterium]